MKIKWKKTKAAIVRKGKLKPVSELAYTNLDDLIGLKEQKEKLIDNTLKFINNDVVNHVLLWGERGCGKSSLVRAVFCKFMDMNLRLIEISTKELKYLHKILDKVRDKKRYKFIIFCDDFGFENTDSSLAELKNLLEGSIQATPSNVIFYATTNLKHLVKSKPNSDNYIIEKENSRENLSLADRFGLHISFYELSIDEYIDIVGKFFENSDIDKEKIKAQALAYAASKGVRSPRNAKQFWQMTKEHIEKL